MGEMCQRRRSPFAIVRIDLIRSGRVYFLTDAPSSRRNNGIIGHWTRNWCVLLRVSVIMGGAFVLSLAFLLLLVPLFRRERNAMSVEDGAGIAPG